MARWDEIMALPIQNPPTPEFSSVDIVWSRVEGWQEGIDRIALIPFSRVSDFVRGESNRKECPTRFHVEARRRRPPSMPYKPKVDGILEYILYWCSFGPDDHRKGGVVRPSRNYTLKRKTPAGRPSTKRGCVCHFIVKRLIAEPSVALVIYNFEKHIDKQGLPCHGPQDKMAVGTRAMFAPYISEELRLQVTSLLFVGVPVETIMERHAESVKKQGGPCNRDDLLTHRCVRRLERKIRRSTYELDPVDETSISLWTEAHLSDVFIYKEYSDSEPFLLGIQTEWQLQQMIHFGNRSLLASDSRLGSSKLKCPIQSLLVFDLKNNAIPVAWIITPEFASGNIHRWLRALYERVHSKDPTWRLGGFIIDDPSLDVHVIREVFQCSVLISFWRARHSWHKNLMRKCLDEESCVEILRRLGKILSCICIEKTEADVFDDFIRDFIDFTAFMDYFKSSWFSKIGIWTDALKTLPLATTESSSAIESYHYQMKLRLLNETDPVVYQRTDWLANKLGTEVHSYYWLDEFAEKDSFIRYWKDEWKSGFTSWQQALQIQDTDIIVSRGYAKVVCKDEEGRAYTVRNPGSEFAICDCSWSRKGNLCKHVIKVSRIYRNRGLVAPSISLFEYNRTLNNIIHCPPHDSIIRDHSIALALSVQKQLNSLTDLKCTQASLLVSPEMQTHPTGSEGLPNPSRSNHNLTNQGLLTSESENAVEITIDHSIINGKSSIKSPIVEENHPTLAAETLCEDANNHVMEDTVNRIELDVNSSFQICPTDSVSVSVANDEILKNKSIKLGNWERDVGAGSSTALTSKDEFTVNLLEDQHVNTLIASTNCNGVGPHAACEVTNMEIAEDAHSCPATMKSVDPEGIGGKPCNLRQPYITPREQRKITDVAKHHADAMIIDAAEAET